MNNGQQVCWPLFIFMMQISGRGERIRTSDHLHPMQVRYQAALRPEDADYSRAPQRMARHAISLMPRIASTRNRVT